MDNYIKNLVERFVNNYKGEKFSIIAAGCGGLFANLLTIPGSSKIINSIHYLQDQNYIDEYCMIPPDKYASFEACHLLMEGFCTNHIFGSAITITGSLTTDRFRKGDNKCFINYNIAHPSGNINTKTELTFDKIPESQHHFHYIKKRESEELFILKSVLNYMASLYENSN